MSITLQKLHTLSPINPTQKEASILMAIKTIRNIIDTHKMQNDFYGNENVILPMIQGARALLNFDLGRRLDMGRLDSLLVEMAEECNINQEDL